MSDDPLQTPEAQEVLYLLRRWKAEQATAEAEVKRHQKALIEIMQDAGALKTSVAVSEDGERRVVTGTMVEPVTVVIDEAKLKRAVGAAIYRKLCKEVLDKSKLEAAVQNGLVDISVVASCSDEVTKSPYVRITTK